MQSMGTVSMASSRSVQRQVQLALFHGWDRCSAHRANLMVNTEGAFQTRVCQAFAPAAD